MLFRQIEYFVALARERHFAHAAAACHVTQPALSEAIRKLEREFGVPLVKRGNTFEGLTPEGESLLPWARRLLSDELAMRQTVTALQQGLTGELRLGAVPAASATAAKLVEPLCVSHPMARVHLLTNIPTTVILSQLEAMELDAGVVYAIPEIAESLDVIPLYQDHQVLIATPALLDGTPTAMTWSEAAELPLCLLNGDMTGRKIIDSAFDSLGIVARPQIATDSIDALIVLVATGRFASIIPHAWYTSVVATTTDIVVVRLTEPASLPAIALVTPEENRTSPLTRALIEITRERFRLPD